MSVVSTVSAQVGQEYVSKTSTKKAQETKSINEYGKTIGKPELSEEGKKYYEQLKEKYSNMDFILVSTEMKAQAQAQAGSFANPNKMVVLIDEEKIERMATDEAYRKKYEAIISGANAQLSQLGKSLEASGTKVKGFGMQVNDGGTVSYFAVLEKSAAAQKERIEKRAEEKKAEKKEAEKKAEKEAAKERLEEHRTKTETVTINASSIEELILKLENYALEDRTNSVQTPIEANVGQHIDIRF
ncbi:MAG: hypothetical protein J6A75_09685 [Lachnospiraceae bacterium]|nr:hypothetical protein [Lachnospiraceae bacterium]